MGANRSSWKASNCRRLSWSGSRRFVLYRPPWSIHLYYTENFLIKLHLSNPFNFEIRLSELNLIPSDENMAIVRVEGPSEVILSPFTDICVSLKQVQLENCMQLKCIGVVQSACCDFWNIWDSCSKLSFLGFVWNTRSPINPTQVLDQHSSKHERGNAT